MTPRTPRTPRTPKAPRTPRARRGPGLGLARLPVWGPPLVCLLLGLLCGGTHALLADRAYAAVGHVLVSGPGEVATNYAQAYGRLATDGAVLAAARADAGVSVAELRGRVRAATSPEVPVIEITGTAPSAAEAARAASAVAAALIAHGNDAAADTEARLSLLAPVSRHATPVSPSPTVSLATGACAGTLPGCLLLLTRPAPGSGPRGPTTPPPGLPAVRAAEAGVPARSGGPA
jgi:hypothetical protein